MGITKVRTNLFIFCYPVNKALYLFPPGFNTLAELREGYRRSIEREQMHIRSRSTLSRWLKRVEDILFLERRSLLPTELPRKAGRRSQDDEN